MKNKKGFTLVELLAVIAILAILVLIALPNILILYRNARENVFVSDVQSILRASQQAYVTNSLTNKSKTCFDSKSNPLDIESRSNLIYKVQLSSDGKITSIQALDNNYQLIKTNGKDIKRDDIGNSKSNKIIKSEARKEGVGLTACDGTSIEEGEEVRTKYVDSELHGADPVLGSGMIPVMLSDTGVATYAHDYDEWYNYASKKWANAVILVDNPSKTDYKEGDTIAESDIRAYFVWIPKYSYRIFNIGDYEGLNGSQPASQIKEIEIEFGTRTTGEVEGECITPMESGSSRASGATKDCQVGDLMTHPAFLSIPSNGFWVGKFETGYNQNGDPSQPITDENIATWTKDKAQVNSNKPNNVIVKPNVYSWRNATVYNLFMNAYNFNRTLDSHMMKNTEWGAVAYLSHSKYGIKDEVRINNNSNYLTGYAANSKDGASSETNNSKWNTTNGHTASTTGNITGVYDMSGGAWEYMAAYIEENAKSSGMDSIIVDNTYNKYLDKYSKSVTSNTAYKYRILGDSTGELGPFWSSSGYYQSTWYADYSVFVEPTYPWFGRGGHYSHTTHAGQFYFDRSTGAADSGFGSRLVLKP